MSEKIIDSLKNIDAQAMHLLSGVDIASLPSIELIDLDSLNEIEPGICAIYFLTHPDYGVLYIGKAKNLRTRWLPKYSDCEARDLAPNANHRMLLPAIKLTGASLRWMEIPASISLIAEDVLLRLYRPMWNTTYSDNFKVERPNSKAMEYFHVREDRPEWYEQIMRERMMEAVKRL